MISPAEAEPRAAAALRAMGLRDTLRPLRPDAPPGQAQLFRAGALLVKVYSPEAADRALRQATRQQALAEAMADGPHRVPPVLYAADATLVMPWIDGTDLATLHGRGTDTGTLAGRWLDRFHGLSRRRFPFRPTGHVNWLDRLVGQAQAGDRTIPDLPAFTDAVRRTQAMADAARKQKATRAVTHRDMTLSNLLHDGSVTWGIDVENTREDEPLRDLFTLALDLATLPVPRGPGTLVAAYGDTHTAPPVHAFLQRCFCHWVWANTPPAPSRRQAARLAAARSHLETGQPVFTQVPGAGVAFS